MVSGPSSARHSGVDSPLASSGPLRRISDFMVDGADGESSPARGSPVPIRLAEPMWRDGHESRLHFLTACMQLQALLERIISLGVGESLDYACAAHPSVGPIVQQLAEAAGLPAGAGGALLVERLEGAGLAGYFHLVAHYLGDRERDYRAKAAPVSHEGYEHTCALNQLVVIATQIRADLDARSHKYAAHKLALLYQAVNLSKLRREELRKRIEAHFEDVKVATELQPPVLSSHLVAWLSQICDDIAGYVRDVPPTLPQKLLPALQFVRG